MLLQKEFKHEKNIINAILRKKGILFERTNTFFLKKQKSSRNLYCTLVHRMVGAHRGKGYESQVLARVITRPLAALDGLT